MPFSIKWLTFVLGISLVVASCKKEEQLQTQTDNVISENLYSRDGFDSIPYKEGTMTSWVKVKNPYSVVNMKLAWDNLVEDGIVTNGSARVKTTHYYVKFKPADSDQYEILHSDSSLSLSDYPIESKIIENGDYYRS